LAYDLIIGLCLCLVGILFLGSGISLTLLLVPVIIGPVFLIALGLSWFFSALGVFIRDVGQLGGFLGTSLTLFEWRILLSRKSKRYGSPYLEFFTMESAFADY
jgi:hypothetical protein